MPMKHWDVNTNEDLADHIQERIEEFGQFTTNWRTVAHVLLGRGTHLRAKTTFESIKEFASDHGFDVRIVDCDFGKPWVVFRTK